MSWRLSLLSCILSMLLRVQGQAPAGAATVTANSIRVHSPVGGVAALTCTARNLGARKVNWVFVKESVTIFHGEQQMVNDPRYIWSHPPESNSYTLQIYPAEDSDQGVYKCEIDGTKHVATIHLNLLGAPETPDLGSVGEPLNRTACCRGRNVSEQCLPVCQPSSAPPESDFLSHCESDLTNLIFCGTDGRNHEDCCARSGVPAGCLMFCSNNQAALSSVSSDELQCLQHNATIISCYEYGAALLPSRPQMLSVLSVTRNNSYTLLVTWKPPLHNPSVVTGYRVFYKRNADARFTATELLSAATSVNFIAAELNMLYSVYVVAVGHHGASQPTDTISIMVEDTFSPGTARDVMACCQAHKVPGRCLSAVCHPRVWAEFNTSQMLDCYSYLPSAFTCLAGERNNTGCCMVNNVPDSCLGMCGGDPPPFDNSLAVCLPFLAVTEACIQAGLATQPQAPQNVTLVSVGTHSAMVRWDAESSSTSDPVVMYYVQLQRGNQQAIWYTVEQVVGVFVELTNLTETEHYSVRVIAQTANASSLPSATIHFKTYPEEVENPRPTIAHNLTQCCVDSGMPSECSAGCQYMANMTDYYAGVLNTCMNHIGTVLTCAADGRDHTSCCLQRNVKEACLPLCVYNTPGSIDFTFLQCIDDTSLIVSCYQEGLVTQVRMPEDVVVTNTTSHTITVEWKNPETGPAPQTYDVKYTKLNNNLSKQEHTKDLTYIIQNLDPGTGYTITVTSVLNDTTSPPSAGITEFTPALDSESPFVPSAPTNTSRALWLNRDHCCQTSGISAACQPVCLNQPSTNSTDCSNEHQKILTCAGDGKDHSLCCRENGLPQECLPLCSSHALNDSFHVRLAGCTADAGLAIIMACFSSSFSGLLPSMPMGFTARNDYGSSVTLQWRPARNCDTDSCTYDVHYWRSDSSDLTTYTTVQSVTSPHSLHDLSPEVRYTFTITAHNSKGSGPPAPWVSLYFDIKSPEVSIVQSPKTQVFDQGTSVSLTCDAFDFVNLPSLTWRLRDRVLPPRGRILHLPQVSNSSEGMYSCTASADNFTVRAESYVNVRFPPVFNYFRTDSVGPNIGAEGVLACWFRGHPDTSDPVNVWKKDDQPIRRESRLSFTVRSRYHTGITAFKLKIANLEPSDYGLYRCDVSNRFGRARVHTRLIDPAKMTTPPPPTQLERRNVSRCCEERQIPASCMPLCTFDVSVEEAVRNPNQFGICLLFLSDLLQCAADGADHTLCCVEQVVPVLCQPLCKGEVPSTSDVFSDPRLLQCVNEASTILDCMDKGYGRIPTAPQRVVASMIGRKIKVAWEPPARNAHFVTSYNIYYNYTGNPRYQLETVTDLIHQNHELNNIDSSHIYYVWMTAERYKFGMSQTSNMVPVSGHGTLPMPPRNVTVTEVKGTTVVITWLPPPSQSAPLEAYAIHYKPRNNVAEDVKLTMGTSFTLRGLQPFTEYTVYLTSRTKDGDGQKSQFIYFKTGEKSQPEPQRQSPSSAGLSSGQVVGVVLAVVVVIAVTAILIVLVCRSRVKRSAETVAFENPSYANPQVHIGGLPYNNPNHSVTQPADSQADQDGSFGYSRLQEDRAAAAAESVYKPVAEVDAPNTDYAGAADPNGVSVDVASKDPAIMKVPPTDLNSESTM